MMKPAGNAMLMLFRSFSKKPKLSPADVSNLKRYNEEVKYLFGPKKRNDENVPLNKETDLSKEVSKTTLTDKEKKVDSNQTKKKSSLSSKKSNKANAKVSTESSAHMPKETLTDVERQVDTKIPTTIKSSSSSKKGDATSTQSSVKQAKNDSCSKNSSAASKSEDGKGHICNQIKSPEFLMHESSLSENERQVLSNILNMPLFDFPSDQQNFTGPWKGLPTPSVSKILKDTMSKQSLMVLARWEKNMIEALGKEGFEKYKRDMFNTGSQLHALIQRFLEKNQPEEEVVPAVRGYWKSLEPVLKDIDNVVALEQMVTNEGLNYRGVFDCVATYKNRPCLVDWKTSQKPKSSLAQTYDQPLQLVAYLSAFNGSLCRGTFDGDPRFDRTVLDKHDLRGGGKVVENCLLVVSYESGAPADVHLMNRKTCAKYWAQWLHRLHKYWLDVFLLAGSKDQKS